MALLRSLRKRSRSMGAVTNSEQVSTEAPPPLPCGSPKSHAITTTTTTTTPLPVPSPAQVTRHALPSKNLIDRHKLRSASAINVDGQVSPTSKATSFTEEFDPDSFRLPTLTPSPSSTLAPLPNSATYHNVDDDEEERMESEGGHMQQLLQPHTPQKSPGHRRTRSITNNNGILRPDSTRFTARRQERADSHQSGSPTTYNEAGFTAKDFASAEAFTYMTNTIMKSKRNKSLPAIPHGFNTRKNKSEEVLASCPPSAPRAEDAIALPSPVAINTNIPRKRASIDEHRRTPSPLHTPDLTGVSDGVGVNEPSSSPHIAPLKAAKVASCNNFGAGDSPAPPNNNNGDDERDGGKTNTDKPTSLPKAAITTLKSSLKNPTLNHTKKPWRAPEPSRPTFVFSPPTDDPFKPAGAQWESESLLNSRPANAWGYSPRWTCCQCGAATMVEQLVCANLDCMHQRCNGTPGGRCAVQGPRSRVGLNFG